MKLFGITIRATAKYLLEKRSYGIKASTPGTAVRRAITEYNLEEENVNPKRKRKITEYSITIKNGSTI